MDWLDLLAVQGTLKSLLQHHTSKASILGTQLSLWPGLSYLCIPGAGPSSGFLSSCFFLIALGLCRCAPAFPSCGQSGLLFVAVVGLLIAVAALAVGHRL